VKGVGTITPLLFAVKKGLTDFYECLLEAGADPNFHDDVSSYFSLRCHMLVVSQTMELLFRHKKMLSNLCKTVNFC
jgi:hypothetical protein